MIPRTRVQQARERAVRAQEAEVVVTDNAIAAMNLSVSLKRDLPDLAEALEEVMSRLNEAVTLDDLMRARHDLLAAYHEGERK